VLSFEGFRTNRWWFHCGLCSCGLSVSPQGDNQTGAKPKIIQQLRRKEVKLIKNSVEWGGHLISFSSLGKLSVRFVSANKLILSVVIAKPWTALRRWRWWWEELTTWTLDTSASRDGAADRQARRDRADSKLNHASGRVGFGYLYLEIFFSLGPKSTYESCASRVCEPNSTFYRIVSLNSLNHLGCSKEQLTRIAKASTHPPRVCRNFEGLGDRDDA